MYVGSYHCMLHLEYFKIIIVLKLRWQFFIVKMIYFCIKIEIVIINWSLFHLSGVGIKVSFYAVKQHNYLTKSIAFVQGLDLSVFRCILALFHFYQAVILLYFILSRFTDPDKKNYSNISYWLLLPM